MTEESKEKDVLIGIVRSVEHGLKGPFAVAMIDGIEGSVTFSLRAPVWKENGPPGRSARVVLSGLVEVDGGWRAESARYKQPSDDK